MGATNTISYPSYQQQQQQQQHNGYNNQISPYQSNQPHRSTTIQYNPSPSPRHKPIKQYSKTPTIQNRQTPHFFPDTPNTNYQQPPLYNLSSAPTHPLQSPRHPIPQSPRS